MSLVYDHTAACTTEGCENAGIDFDVPTFNGHISPMICGACGTNFSDNIVPKA